MQALDRDAALVLYSGGQDSAIALAWALARFERVFTVGFDYRQRHAIELKQRLALLDAILDQNPVWAARFQSDHVLDIGALGAISETSLTRATDIQNDDATGLPTTFVPGRNLIFLSFAAALAYRLRARTLVGGMCEADYSGYPDCRRETLTAQLDALRSGMDADFALETPLSSLTKAESWRLAESLGGSSLVDAIVEHSHSCYLGVRGERWEWGYGCGSCPACVLRARGWHEYASAAR